MNAQVERSNVENAVASGLQSVRSTVAYSVLMLGLAATIAIVPLAAFALVAHGFR